MHRCLQLAKLATGQVAPNPLVGSVLVYNDHIIGEGYHQVYGQAHAEVNCIASVKEDDRQFIKDSILYVSLEPCAHFGKTPPCAELIIKENIKSVIIGCRDPFELVDGKGIEKLRSAGIEVETGILEKECLEINKAFFTFYKHHRPFVFLKWAQTGDGKMAALGNERLLITNEKSNRLVHKWRSEVQSILVGTNTALLDDPELTTRLWPGQNPVRLVVDLNLRLPSTLKLFDGKVKTIVFNLIKSHEGNNLNFFKISKEIGVAGQILNALYHLNIQSLLVEGGTQMLQSFINEDEWDEAKVITNESLLVGKGLPAPQLQNHQYAGSEQFQSDKINYYRNQRHSNP